MEYGLIVALVLAPLGALYLFKLYIIFLDFYILTFESVPTWIIWLVVIFFPPFLILVVSGYLRKSLTNRRDENLKHLEIGLELLAAGETQKAIQSLLVPALRGDSNAMLALSATYEAMGDGQQAFYWINKAYETSPKDDLTLLTLAEHYLLGSGTDKDFRMCRKLCEKIGDNTPACPNSTFTLKAQSIFLIAMTYMSDSHVGGWDENSTSKDISKAFGLLEKSGEMGYMKAYDFLGAALMLGEVVSQDKEKGLNYLKKAASAGCLHSIIDLFNHSIGKINDPNRFHDAYFWGVIMMRLNVYDIDAIIENIGKYVGLDKFHLDLDIETYTLNFFQPDYQLYNAEVLLLSNSSLDIMQHSLRKVLLR